MRLLEKFRADEDGAVSADWVVLTAAIVPFALIVAMLVRDGAITGGENIQNKVVALATP